MLSLVIQSVALSVVFHKGTIFRHLREGGPALWREMASCPLCSGVWIGAGWFLLRTALASGVAALRSTSILLDALVAGALTSVLSLAVVLLLALLNKHS